MAQQLDFPHSREAEQAVLSACMSDKGALMDILTMLEPEDFYEGAHRTIYETIADLFQNHAMFPDLVTVRDRLKSNGSLEALGGDAYLAILNGAAPSISNAASYAKIVLEKSQLRRLILSSDEIKDQALRQGEEAERILDNAEQMIFEIATRKQGRDYFPLSQILPETLAMMDKAAKAEGGMTGVPTGFSHLDKITSGLQPSNLIIVAARPSMGKSAFAINIALNAAKKKDAKVLIFSLEMSKSDILNRMLSMESNIEATKIKDGRLDRTDWQSFAYTSDALAKLPVYIDDTPGISVMEMKNKCRRLRREHGLDLVVVDYMQLMSVTGKVESRQLEISKISRDFKLLAREMDCPVIVLSQLSRAPDQRSDHRPMLSDLRESGSIEQDADVVMFLYRDDYYHPDDSDNPGVCEVHIAKHRNGETATIELAWISRYTKFSDIAKEPQ